MKQLLEKLIPGGLAAIFLGLMSRFFLIEEALAMLLLTVVLGALLAGIILVVLRLIKKPLSTPRRIAFWCTTSIQVVVAATIIWSVFPRSVDKQQLISDLNHAQAVMEDIHPDLYATIDKEKFLAASDELKAGLPENVSEAKCIKTFCRMLALIKDGHTSVAMDNYTKRGAILFRQGPPYIFRIEGDRIFVQKSYYGRNRIPVGSEIVRINGKTATACLAEMEKLISFETSVYRDATLSLPIFWNIWNDYGDFEYSYITPQNEEITEKSTGKLFANIALIKDLIGVKNSFKVIGGNIALLDLRAFEGAAEFEALLADSFGEIQEKGISDLIIDLRNNRGGATNLSEELMQYVARSDFRSFDLSLIKISNDLHARITVNIDKYPIGTLVDEELDMVPLRDNPLRFAGNVYVLTSGSCFSTALDFPAMIRCYEAGLLIGTETGGRTASFGSPQGVSMPETGIQIKVSRKQFINPCDTQTDSGLIPDYVVENTITDDINQTDRALEFAIELIGKTAADSIP